MKNLEAFVQKVWTSTGQAKRDAMVDLINSSHAKKATKTDALFKVTKLSDKQLDKFAVNFMMSGEGLSV